MSYRKLRGLEHRLSFHEFSRLVIGVVYYISSNLQQHGLNPMVVWPILLIANIKGDSDKNHVLLNFRLKSGKS